MIKRKVKVPNVVNGGKAHPLGDNLYYITGKSHEQGGVDIGRNPKTGLEVEGGEVMQMGDKDVKVFSRVNFLGGKSPADLVLEGHSPNKVFKAQERFKRVNGFNDDGSRKARYGINMKNNYKLPEVVITGKKPTFFDRLGRRFRNATIGAAMADSPAIMTASGWRRKNNGDYVQDKQDDEGVSRLRGNLTDISMMSPTNPITAVTDAALKGAVSAGNAGLRYLDLHTSPNNKIATKIINTFGIDKLPENYAYRRTTAQEYDDIAENKVFRRMPEEKYLPSEKTVTKNGWEFDFGRPEGRDHGGKSFSKGEPWKYSTSSSSKQKEILVGVKGDATKWRTGYHGRYSAPKDFDDIPKGTGLFIRYNADDIAEELPTTGLRWYDYAGNRYKRYKRYKMGGKSKIYSITVGGKTRLVHSPSTGGRAKADLGIKRRIAKGLDMADDAVKRFMFDRGNLTDDISWKDAWEQEVSGEMEAKDRERLIKEGKAIEVNLPGNKKKLVYTNQEARVRGPRARTFANAVRGASNLASRMKSTPKPSVAPKTVAPKPAPKPAPTVTSNPVNTPTQEQSVQAAREAVTNPKSTVWRNTKAYTKKAIHQINSGIATGNKSQAVIGANKIIGPATAITGSTVTGFNLGFDTATKNNAKQNTTNKVSKVNINPKFMDEAMGHANGSKLHSAQARLRRKGYSSKFLANSMAIDTNFNLGMPDWVNISSYNSENAEVPYRNDGKVAKSTNNSSVNNTSDNPVKKETVVPTNKVTKPVNKTTVPVRRTTTKPKSTPSEVKSKIKYNNPEAFDAVSRLHNIKPIEIGKPNPLVVTGRPQSKVTPVYSPVTNPVGDSKISLNLNKETPIEDRPQPKITPKAVIPPKGTKFPRLKKFFDDKNNARDAVGLASNIGGSIIGALVNRGMLNRQKAPSAPMYKPAAKLKTRININPQLDKMRETAAAYEDMIDTNTASSNVALARKQRNRFNNALTTNELYGTKENLETELINKDKLNQQAVAGQNVDTYNNWRDRLTTFDNAIAEKRSENINNTIGNINAGIQDVITRRDRRDAENKTIGAMAAAAPNSYEYLYHLGLIPESQYRLLKNK